MRRLPLPLAVLLLTAPSTAAPTTHEFHPDTGRWHEVQAPTTRPTSDQTLDRVEQLIQKNQNTAARKLALTWLKSHKDSPLRDRAIFLLAQAYFQYGDRVRAFYHLDELMDNYPDSPLFYHALEKQYQIADAYLRGYKIRFLMVPLFGAENEAVEMLFRIQQRSPGSPLAEKALRRTADYYFADRQYDLAFDAYASYNRSYPRSPDIPIVKLRQAFSALAQFRGSPFDASTLLDARALLGDIAQRHPDLADQENLAEVVRRIDATFSGKLYDTADFYRRTNKPRAAVYLYRYLIKTYPQSRQAAKSQEQLRHMPKWALDGPEPSPGNGYAPTTIPTLRPLKEKR